MEGEQKPNSDSVKCYQAINQVFYPLGIIGVSVYHNGVSQTV